ncbi:Holliday junction resolvase RusA (prophage-encoded endonuclease) [Alkalithermobacter thermoalcaliphilus JW-YL-7 = DSM 7308]|nr:Holliday junction resolvase RusA (prophage-encoded endonuclease) [[Clostridium] paradoxum JW-YL-7 = DSM 7308]
MERSFKRVELVIPGEPVAKGRPRVGKGFTYTPKKTVIYENFVKECYIITNTNKKLTGAIFCEIKAYFQIPKSKSKKIKEKMKAGEERPTKKPDLDNLAKSILDSLNQIAYDDDSQVVELKMSKFYSDNPRVEVILQEI